MTTGSFITDMGIVALFFVLLGLALFLLELIALAGARVMRWMGLLH